MIGTVRFFKTLIHKRYQMQNLLQEQVILKISLISTNGSSYRRFPPTTDCRSTVRIFTGKIRDAAEHFRFHDSY